MRASTKKRIAVGLVLVGSGLALAASDLRLAHRLPIRNGSCDGVPCSVQVFEGPPGRLFVRIEKATFDVDLPSHQADQAPPDALTPTPFGGFYRTRHLGNPPRDRTKYILTPVLQEDGAITIVSPWLGRITFTLSG